METIKYKGFSIKIETDECPQNPRTEWDNLGTMVCFHSRYNLGDKHNYSHPDDFIEECKTEQRIILPLYLYDHSGITISTGRFSCPWDSGQVGWIYIDKAKVREEYGWKKLTKARIKTIEGYLKGEVETFDNYITGNVYGFSVEDNDGNDIDSCWGFFGDDHKASGLLEMAENAIDCEIQNRIKTHLNQLKTWIKNHVPFYARKPLALI